MPHDASRIVQALVDHLTTFVERPHPAFGHKPVCPFARNARRGGAVRFEVVAFDLDRCDPTVLALVAATPDDGVLVVAHPDPGVPNDRLEAAGALYEQTLPEFLVFCAHPASPFRFNGVLTRREPYPTLQFIRKALLADARAKLSPAYFADGDRERVRP